MNIDWNYPEPRKGPLGSWDKFAGPGATAAEVILLAVSVVAAAVVAYLTRDTGWNAARIVVALLIAMDLFGGVVTNAASSAKRWYHREGQKPIQHFTFVAAHLHPFIVAWLFRDMDWAFGAVIYGYLLLSSIIIMASPLYLQRPLAMLLYLGAVFIGQYIFYPTPGMAWFVPAFFLKLLICHLLREEPYRPQGEATGGKG